MSEISKQALKVENNQSFPNNNAGLITPSALRTFNENMIDSTVNQAVYTTDSGSWNTRIGESVTTASLSGSNILFEKDNGDTFAIPIATAGLPSGVISGSSQVILQQTTGNLSGSRIDGAVTSSLTSSISNEALDVVVNVKNTTGTQINKGTIVRIIGATGDNPLIQTASWDNDGTSANTLGWVQSNIPNGEFGKVITQGTLLGVNTDPTQGFAAGQMLYLSSSGQFTNIVPPAPYHEVRLGQVLRAQQNNGSVFVLIQNGYELGELHDVNINTGSLANKDLLSYNSASGQWVNSSIGGLGIATTGSNTFSGNQTITTSGDKSGVFYKSGSSDFFLGLNGNGNFALSGSQDARLFEVNKSSNWIEYYAPQINFNSGVSLRGTTNVRGITTDTGNGFVAQFDGFTASLQEGYAWVGKSGGTSISVPTASFAGAVPVGVATTGSNTFTGAQVIESTLTIARPDNPLILTNISQDAVTDKLEFSQAGGTGFDFNNDVYVDGDKRLYIKRSNTGANNLLRLGSTDNTFNFAFIVTGSDTNPGQQVWGINNAGGVWGNSFDAGVVFNSHVTASSGINISNGTFSAPLQQGYAWVGNASGRTQAVPTSSFAGGGTINTGSFATTGSNTFTGNQTINSPGGNGITINNGGITSAGTIIGGNNIYSFGQYAGIGIQQNAQGSGSQYPGMNIIVAPNTYPTDIFGGFSILTEQGALAGQTFLGMASSTYSPQYGGTNVPMIIANGNNPGGNDTAIIWKSDGVAEHWKRSDFKYGVNVTGSLSVSGSTNTFGNVTVNSGNVSVSGRITSGNGLQTTGSFNVLSPTASNESQIDFIKLPTFVGSNGTTYVNSTFSLGDYASSGIDQTFWIEYANSSFEKYSALLVGPSRTQFIVGTGTGYDYDVIELLDNNNNTTTGKIKADTIILQGPTQVTGSLSASGSANVIGNLAVNSGNVTISGKITNGGGIESTGSFKALIPTASNESQILLFDLPTFVAANGTTYSTANISLSDYASSQIDQTFTIEFANDSFEKYSAMYVGPSRTQFIVGAGSGYDYDVIELLDNNNNTTTAKVKADTVILQGTTQVTGSIGVSSVMNLKPQNPLPSGTIGDLAVSGSNLYFYNGAWTLVI